MDQQEDASRRTFLRRALALGAIGAGGGTLLSACAGGESGEGSGTGESTGDPGESDAPFVAPLEDLEGSFDDATEVRIESGDATVELPLPDEAEVTVTTVERPGFLGGSRESGTVVFRWDSRG